MKLHLSFICLCAVASLTLSGCFTAERAKVKTTGEEHVMVANYGWSLFNCIPLFCGNASDDPATPWAFFRDDVTEEKLQKRFDALANGREIKYPCCQSYDTVIWSVFGIPIPYVICYKELTISGVFK